MAEITIQPTLSSKPAQIPAITNNVRFGGLRFKVIVGFTLVFTLVFGLAYYWFYSFSTTAAVQRVADDLKATLEGAAALVDGDSLAKLIVDVPADGTSYPTDQRYWDHVHFLYMINKLEPRAFAYTFRNGPSKNQVTWIGSVGAAPELFDPPIGVKLGEVCTNGDGCNLDDNFEALNDGKTVVVPDVYTDKWGSWLSGSAPFYDSKGNLVGGLGLDFRADYVQEVQNKILDKVVVAFAITYGALFLLVYFVAGALTNPIRKFARIAQLVGDGQYDNVDDLVGLKRGFWRDETNALAEIFGDMVGKVRHRETELKRRVNELKIKIDQSKASEQVREIVDTDFFEHLTNRAGDIRARRRNPSNDDVT
ncbi:MAG: hypothetical protein R3E39_22085 [Anaerolineae bacterium]